MTAASVSMCETRLRSLAKQPSASSRVAGDKRDCGNRDSSAGTEMEKYGKEIT